MAQILTILVMVGSLVVCLLWHPGWAWLPVLAVDLFLCIQLCVAKWRCRCGYVPQLSPDANDLLRRYGHYFMMPFASVDFSACAATSQFAGLIFALIGVLKGFWWAIAFAIANWFLMGAIAVSLSPRALLSHDPTLRSAYEEVLEFLKVKHPSRTPEHQRSAE